MDKWYRQLQAVPTKAREKLLYRSIQTGNVHMMNALMVFPDAWTNIDEIREEAETHQRHEILQFLDTFDHGNPHLIRAIKEGNLRAVQIALDAPGIDPSIENNRALLLAAERNHLDIVKQLLPFPGVINGIDDAIRKAGAYQNISLALFLQQYQLALKGKPIIIFPKIIPFTLADMPNF